MKKKPTKTEEKPVIRSFRIPTPLWTDLSRIAERNRRSIAAELITQLEFALTHNGENT
jgi:predicted DNA-binding ribbon-helix-helix protein